MTTQHSKLDAILEQLAELTAKVDALTVLQPSISRPSAALQPPSAKPDAEDINSANFKQKQAETSELLDEANLWQDYTFALNGQRDYRHPSSVPADELSRAKEWHSNGRPNIARHQFAGFTEPSRQPITQTVGG
ncbi:hypothetical protein [Ruegeria sp. HKCCC2117]|uniref:hypothetical protein n=1 Tax=Ruegeria sp. HKCCC2117 TaxID=2682992 RepID=UPI001487D7C1|nr:hypothetical protein [Ruegeria sp. HKCCC2117]